MEVLMQGALDKKMKSRMRGFKSRWFLLRPKELVYYESEAAAQKNPEAPLGIIPLANCILEKPHGASATKNAFRLSFEIATLKTAAEITGNTAGKDAKQLKYVLAAQDVETQMRWEELIREQIWNASTTAEEKIKKERKLTGFEAPEKPDMPLALAGATIQEEDEYDEEAEDDDFD